MFIESNVMAKYISIPIEGYVEYRDGVFKELAISFFRFILCRLLIELFSIWMGKSKVIFKWKCLPLRHPVLRNVKISRALYELLFISMAS